MWGELIDQRAGGRGDSPHNGSMLETVFAEFARTPRVWRAVGAFHLARRFSSSPFGRFSVRDNEPDSRAHFTHHFVEQRRFHLHQMAALGEAAFVDVGDVFAEGGEAFLLQAAVFGGEVA